MKKLTLKRALGKTGLEVPPIIFGTSALGNLYSAVEDNIKLNIVKECFEHVQRPVVFDCAGKYGAGLALEMLGKNLKKLKIKKDEVIISNKLAWIRTPLTTPEPTFEPGVWFDLTNCLEKIITLSSSPFMIRMSMLILLKVHRRRKNYTNR